MSFEWYGSRDILWEILIALILLTIWWVGGREKIGMPMMNTLMKKKSTSSCIMLFLWTIRGLIFLLIGFAFLHPNLTREKLVAEMTDDRSILLLDISRSMLADDIKPDRITKAKELIDRLLSRKSTRNIGYIVFAGKSFVLTPPTSDRESLRNLVQATSPETIDQSLKDTSGTNIGDAIILGNDLLSGSLSEKSLILITDGRANVGIDPLIAAKESAKQNIKIYTIGIGEASGAILSYLGPSGKREYFYDGSGSKIQADIDTKTLTAIADITSGKYFSGKDIDSLIRVFDEVGKITDTQPTYKKERITETLLPYILLALILFGLLHAFIAFQIQKKYKVR